MIVVADTGPVNYLALIGEAELLGQLYGRVLIPPAVFAELQHRRTPLAVREWVGRNPTWLEVRTPARGSQERIEKLDFGESEAVALAEEHLPDVLLLIDDEAGRMSATRRGIRTTGTLGVLEDAAARGWVDLSVAIERMRSTNFRADNSLLEWFLARDRRRKKGE